MPMQKGVEVAKEATGSMPMPMKEGVEAVKSNNDMPMKSFIVIK